MTTIHDEIARLRRENDALRDKLAKYRSIMSDINDRAAALSARTRLTYNHAKMVVLLSDGRVVSREQFQDALGRSENSGIRSIDSHIKRIRLTTTAIKIDCVYGFGYVIKAENLAAAKRFIAGPAPSRTPLTGHEEAAH